jgi:GDPmannose 4,6-dehydratase
MQWLMLQQNEPDDYVIATGLQYSVRDFVTEAASELGMTMRWEGSGVDEVGIVDTVDSCKVDGCCVKPGNVIIRVDPRYFRLTEVETLLGDPTKAREKLGWTPKIPFKKLVSEMIRADLDYGRRDALCIREGYKVNNCFE